MGPVAQQAGRLGLHVLGVEEDDGPPVCARLLSQDFEIHDGIGPALVGHTALPRDVVGEIVGPGAERDRSDRLGHSSRDLGQRSRRGSAYRRPHFRHQRCKGGVVELLPGLMERESGSLVVDRCHRQTGFDQLDAPTVDDPVIGRCGHGDRPAVVMGDADAHAGDSASRCRSASTAADTTGGPFARLFSRHADSKLGARSGTRTRTPFRTEAFEASASAIPPSGRERLIVQAAIYGGGVGTPPPKPSPPTSPTSPGLPSTSCG